jgi:hypothetical protein
MPYENIGLSDILFTIRFGFYLTLGLSHMTDARLLAVVEVPQSDRVVCQALGCKHPVYKRIHVVLENGALTVLGSECFKKLFGEELSTPSYGSSEGRLLTAEERQLLIENTARLIAQFEAEHQAALKRARVAAEQQAALARAAEDAPKAVPPLSPPRAISESDPRFYGALLQAKQEFRSRGLDPDLPGWKGLVIHRAKELLR